MGYLFDRLRMDGKVAVVTGAGRGIGLACAEALADAGATVVIADLNEDLCAAGQSAMLEKGLQSSTALLDVTSTECVDQLANQIKREHGRLDILVCNAGIHVSAPVEEHTDEQWLSVNDVNYNGVFRCCRSFGRIMLEAGRGSIVNMGSMSGLIVNKPQPQAAYNASKAGVHHLTRIFAAEWASKGVRVNAVAPTYIRTPLTEFVKENRYWYDTWINFTPMGRLGEVEEVASAVHFLASDAASLITGSVLSVDGGYTSW